MKSKAVLEMEDLMEALDKALKQGYAKPDKLYIDPAGYEAFRKAIYPQPNGLQRAIKKIKKR